MDQIDQWLQKYKDQYDANCKKLGTRLDRLETNQTRTPDLLKENESRARRRQAEQ